MDLVPGSYQFSGSISDLYIGGWRNCLDWVGKLEVAGDGAVKIYYIWSPHIGLYCRTEDLVIQEHIDPSNPDRSEADKVWRVRVREYLTQEEKDKLETN